MNDQLFQAINDQIREEFHSAWLYLSMSTWLESQNLQGFAKWMKIQATEEAKHAAKILEYAQDRGHQPLLQAIGQPPHQWKSALEVFEAALAHEKHITACFQKLMDLAHEAKDYAAIAFLNWFVSEQVEEEKSTDEWVRKLRMVGDSKGGLLQLDHQAGKRE